jgi:hypothetical protein
MMMGRIEFLSELSTLQHFFAGRGGDVEVVTFDFTGFSWLSRWLLLQTEAIAPRMKGWELMFRRLW